MKIILKLSIGFGCFLIGICFYQYVEFKQIEASRNGVASYISRTLPSMSPSEVLRHFWQFASENRIEELRMFVTIEPKSMSIFCEGEDLDDNFRQPSLIQEGEYAGLTKILASDATMLRINRPGVQKLTITKERIYKDEAIVEATYLRSSHRYYLKKEANGWKLFSSSGTDLDFMKDTYFAKERPVCETTSEIDLSKKKND